MSPALAAILLTALPAESHIGEEPAPIPAQAAAEATAAPAPAPEKPAKKLGGTLFERMASASRGGNKSDDDDKDPLDIPRFLRSQNNQ